MKFLLTSGGITNNSIREALVDLLGKPIAESKALCIPTATYAVPRGPAYAWQQIREWGEMGWKEFGVLELTALPSMLQEHWLPLLEAADALLVGGGDEFYLCYWIQQSGLAETLPSLLQDKVYVGVSAGSTLVTQSLEDEYDGTAPHLGADYLPTASLANMEKCAARVDVPLYAIDDQTAIKVINGAIEVVSEGQWKRFAH